MTKNKPIQNTKSPTYADILKEKQTVKWKTLLDVQAPYRWHLRSLKPGYILDIGCGIGRNLKHIKGNGVGIDHNSQMVEMVKSLGMSAFTVEEFKGSGSDIPNHFDSLLLAHVAEHMTKTEAVDLIKKYLPYLKPGGRLIIFTPQEAGYKSDSTHVEFMDFSKLRDISKQLNLIAIKEYSFPFPRFIGPLFTYNEFVSISVKP
jgi:SAM-dependent methyltransferase